MRENSQLHYSKATESNADYKMFKGIPLTYKFRWKYCYKNNVITKSRNKYKISR